MPGSEYKLKIGSRVMFKHDALKIAVDCEGYGEEEMRDRMERLEREHTEFIIAERTRIWHNVSGGRYALIKIAEYRNHFEWLEDMFMPVNLDPCSIEIE